MPILTTLGAACARAWGFTSGLLKDPYFNLTTLLLRGNGTNATNNRDFRDSGTANGGTGFSITPNGNVTQGSFSPFSQTGWGNYFTGSGSTYLTVPDSTSWVIDTDYTIEFWVYASSFPGQYNNIVAQRNSGGTAYWGLNYDTSLGWAFFWNNGSGETKITRNQNSPLNNWVHVAVTRSSGTGYMFLNGSQAGATFSFGAISDIVSSLFIGAWPTGGDLLNGYISNLRLVKGRAIYTSNFNPPVVPLTRTTGGSNPPQGSECVLLTCQSNRFLDSNGVNTPASSPLTITTSGSPSVVAFSPFAPTAAYTTSVVGGSGYFDGNGDYLTVPDSASLELGSSSFTIQAWVYVTGLPSAGNLKGIFAKSGSPYGGFYFCINSSGVIKLYASTTGSTWDIANDVGTLTAPLNAWTHIALSRSGSNWRIWVNGASSGTITSSATIWDTTNSWYICSNGTGAENFTGYLSGASFVIGSTVFDPTSSTITIPTSPPTNITNTSLLLNFTNGAIFDATAKNDLETVGNAQISTTQSKWGGSSIYLDGTGDYLAGATKSSVYFNLTGDFTIETWAYFTTVATGFAGIVSWADSSGFNGWELINNAGTVYFRFLTGSTGVGQVTAGSAISANQWYYISVIRSGSTITLYINGSSVGSTTYSGSQTSESSFLKVGADRDGTALMTGYLQDMRISKYVRPTTVPTAPFPVQ